MRCIFVEVHLPLDITELEEFIEVVKGAREGWRGPQPEVEIIFDTRGTGWGSHDSRRLVAYIKSNKQPSTESRQP